MPNVGNFHILSTKVILDKTILNEDVSDTANIDRSKMNESQDLNVKGGKKLYLWDSTNAKYFSHYFGAAHSYMQTNSGNLFVSAATGIFAVFNPGITSYIRTLGTTESYYLQLSHNDTDGEIKVIPGDLKLGPAGNINCSAKELQNVSKFVYDTAKTRYLSIAPGDFVEHYGSPAPPHILDATIRSSSNTDAAYVVAGVHLPHAAVVTSFKVFWYRDDALAAGTARLAKIDSNETRLTMATADSDQTVGYHTVEDTTISDATIDNSLYTYNIYVTVDPNDVNSDVRFIGAIITYTINEPNP